MTASLSSVVTRGFGAPGSLSLVVTQGYGLAGSAPPPPAPIPQTRFGGGPFWRNACDWTTEDERELEKLEREERELEKRLAKSQRTSERQETLPESATAAQEARRAKRLEEQGERIEKLVIRLATVQRAIAEKEEEREEAEFFDCVMKILMEEEE